MNKIRFLLVICSFLLMNSTLFAYEEGSGILKENKPYDIYVRQTDESVIIVSNVEVVGFVSIGEKKFLAIRSYGFNIKDDIGYILFDSVIAIFPDKNLKFNDINKVKIKY